MLSDKLLKGIAGHLIERVLTAERENKRLRAALREQRAFMRSVANCTFGSKLNDDDYRQRMYRTADEQAARIDTALGHRSRAGRKVK